MKPKRTVKKGSSGSRKTGPQPARVHKAAREEDPGVRHADLKKELQELRSLQQEVQESRRRSAVLYGLAPVAYFTLDVKGTIRDVNMAGSLLLGREQEFLLNKHFSRFLHSADLNRFHAHLITALESGMPRTSEFRIRRNDDEFFYAEFRTLSMNGGGQDELCQTVVTDITERRNFEELLLESEKRYLDLAESSPEAIVVQQDGKCIYVNYAGLALFGAKSRGELLGKNIFDLVPRSTPSPHLEENRSGSPLQEQELQIHRLDGGMREAEELSSPILIGGRPANQVIIRDVTARRMAEKSLRFQAEMLSQVKDAIVVIDSASSVTYWNRGAELLYQISAADALGRRLEEISTYRWNDPGTLRTGSSWRGEGVHQVLNGRRLYLESTVSVLTDDNGTPAGLLAVIHDVTDHKVLEQELRASEAEFRSIFEMSAVGKAQVDPVTGRFIRVNRKMSDITGYTTEELLAMTFSQITHPEDRDRDAALCERALRKQTPGWTSEKRYIRRDGAVIWVKVAGTVLFNDQGKPLHAIGMVLDITDRKFADQALRESEERYRVLVESSPEAILVLQEGLCVYMNPAGLELLGGLTLEDIQAKNIDFVHPHFRAAFAERARVIEERAQPGPLQELKILRLNGKEVDVESTASPISFNGRPAVQIIMKDMTERKSTELRLRLQGTVLSQVSDAVVAVGRDGLVIFWNNAAERLYKLPAREAIGRPREEIYRYRWPTPQDEKAARESMASTGFLRGENVHVLSSTGEEVVVESSVSVLQDWSGNPAGWLAVMRDVTERKHFEQKLRESEERYRSLVESSPDAIFVSQAGRLAYVNQATLKLTGAGDAAALLGREVLPFVHPAYLDRVEARLREAEEDGVGIASRESRILRLDGSSVPVESVLIPIVFQGRPAVQIIVKDITERKAFEEALLESERLYRLMFESNPHPMWMYDTDTLAFLNVNDAALAHYGYSREEFLSMHLKDIRPAEDRSILIDNVSKIAAGLHDSGTWRHRKKDGTIIDAELLSHSLKIDGTDARVVLAHDVTERKKAEAALLESQLAYRTLAENLPGIVYRVLCRQGGRIQFFNKAAMTITGYRDDELSGGTVCSLETLILPEDRPAVVESIQRSVVERTSYSIEYRLRHRNGDTRFMLEQGSPMYGPEGVLLYLDGVISDVTERKLAEQALRESEERQRAVFDNSPMAIFAKDLQGRFLLFNRQAEQWAGRNRDAILGLTDYDLFPKETADRLRANDRKVIETNAPVETEEVIVYGGREQIHLDIKFPLADAAGATYAVCCISTDITERKQAEDELKRARIELELRVRERTAELAATVTALQVEIAERRRTAAERDKLVAAVEAAAEAIVVTDRRGIIQYVNPAFEKITGYRKEEAAGKDIHTFDSGQHDEDFYERMRETIRAQGVWKGRLINKKKDGTIYYEDCTYSPVKDGSGNIVNYVSIKHDVSEKLRLEAIAEAVDAMNNIGYVFSGIRHEIGNPVSSLLIIMSLLKKKCDTSSKEAIREYVEQAISQVERIEYLLTSLKSYNMYENLQIRSITMSSFLEKFLPLVTADLEKKAITFRVAGAPAAETISADPRALQQALLNIIVNASDAVAGRPEPEIVLNIARTGNMVNIRVTDNGTGISEEKKKDLFRPFYTTKPHGTGLGLVISRKLVSRMKGFIEISSRVDKGTVVDIYLPEGTVERSA
ncbi:MAG: hypothetical protein A2078_13160 [Nitrospirae bacterium GWC2_57_9]|nr:MAG: hypothetical protein A2078_13160 [Nitrospirae bacterium GWC2_57_9]